MLMQDQKVSTLSMEAAVVILLFQGLQTSWDALQPLQHAHQQRSWLRAVAAKAHAAARHSTIHDSTALHMMAPATCLARTP